MAISKLHELYVMFGSAVCGIVLGFVFDIFRSFRKCFKFSDKAVAVQDLIYWIIALIIIYSATYITNYAELRIYEFLCIAAGIWLYMNYLSKYIIDILCNIIEVLFGAFKKLYYIIRVPVRLFFGCVGKLVSSIKSAVFNILVKMYKKLTKTTHKSKTLGLKFCKRFRNS